MKRTLSNRPVAAIVAVFTLISAWLLHGNPFGSGTISWPIALVVALAGNCLLAYVLGAWAAPYLASTGGQSGAKDADPETVAVAERWAAGTLLTFAALGLFSIGLTSQTVIITPTARLEENAKLVQRTAESQAPLVYQRQLTAADTWKMSDKTYRTCLPTPDDLETGWCVLAQVKDDQLQVVRYGVGPSNAAQALEWHPELKDQERRGY